MLLTGVISFIQAGHARYTTFSYALVCQASLSLSIFVTNLPTP
jgi:hypothetical protein